MKILSLAFFALHCLFAPFALGDEEEKKIAEAMPAKPTVKPKKSHKPKKAASAKRTPKVGERLALVCSAPGRFFM